MILGSLIIIMISIHNYYYVKIVAIIINFYSCMANKSVG